MRDRQRTKYRPRLERLELRQPLAVSSPVTHLAHAVAPPPAASAAQTGVSARAIKPNFGYLVYRITNPTGGFNTLTPPFGHVLVQERQPIPGQTYNILQVAVKNGTKITFDASSGLQVRLPYQNYFPILTGNETWKPGQDYIFYVLTKRYYPMASVVTSGFQFKLGGAWSTAIPGPSGIFLRIKYNPATINKILDYVVTRGPGTEGGAGIPLGLPVTSIYEFVSAKENRKDFGGYF